MISTRVFGAILGGGGDDKYLDYPNDKEGIASAGWPETLRALLGQSRGILVCRKVADAPQTPVASAAGAAPTAIQGKPKAYQTARTDRHSYKKLAPISAGFMPDMADMMAMMQSQGRGAPGPRPPMPQPQQQ